MAFIVAARALAVLLAAPLLASPAILNLLDEIQTVPAGDWAFRDVPLHREPARVIADYQVLEGSTRIRMALMLREDLERMSSDLPGSIISTGEARRAFFADSVRRTGDYVIVLDNQDKRQPARVRLRVRLDYGSDTESGVGRLTPRRQLTVVAVSCVAFLGIVGFSARRLRQAMRP